MYPAHDTFSQYKYNNNNDQYDQPLCTNAWGGQADYWGLGDKGAGGGGGGGREEVRCLGSLEAGEIVKGLNDFPAVNRSGRKSTVRRPSLAADFLLSPFFLNRLFICLVHSRTSRLIPQDCMTST